MVVAYVGLEVEYTESYPCDSIEGVSFLTFDSKHHLHVQFNKKYYDVMSHYFTGYYNPKSCSYNLVLYWDWTHNKNIYPLSFHCYVLFIALV